METWNLELAEVSYIVEWNMRPVGVVFPAGFQGWVEWSNGRVVALQILKMYSPEVLTGVDFLSNCTPSGLVFVSTPSAFSLRSFTSAFGFVIRRRGAIAPY